MEQGPGLVCVLAILGVAFVNGLNLRSGEEESLIGWKGESFRPGDVFGQKASASQNVSEPWEEVISWHPRAFVMHNFLTEEECEYIKTLAKPQMRRSTVVGGDGKSVLDNIRTSYGTFLRRKEDAIVTKLEEKLAAWTKFPISHQEDVQILRYQYGQKYGAHWDVFEEKGPRAATVLVYLADKDLFGGETAFPDSDEWADPSIPERIGPFSNCAEGHVAFRPKKGDALLFYSVKPDGEQDMKALHTGCPVVTGVKWTATIWIHTLPFHPEWLSQKHAVDVANERDPGECVDYHDSCPNWAKNNGCKKNQGYMEGDGYLLGTCRLSCHLCHPCPEGDADCRRKLREEAGFLGDLTID